VLRLVTEKLGACIWKDGHSVIARDGPGFAPRITRQACVRDRIDVAGADTLARLKLGGHRHTPARWFAIEQGGYLVGSQSRALLRRIRRRYSAFNFSTRHETGFSQAFDKAGSGRRPIRGRFAGPPDRRNFGVTRPNHD
jgi:hypothetical protein